MTEIWKDVEGYEGRYKVSNTGKVWGSYRNKLIAQETIWCGYKRVGLQKDKVYKHALVHRLVAEAFLPKPAGMTEINHIDEDKSNNCVDNLEWTTRKGNMNHGTVQQRRFAKLANDPRQSKPILQMTLDGEVINEFPSINEARRRGYSAGDICNVCQGKKKKYRGYLWMYKE